MYVLFDEHLQENQIAFQFRTEKGDEGGVGNYTSLYKACLDMLDQDYIMKVIIRDFHVLVPVCTRLMLNPL
jgi:hypothetical protein